jgi:hypothetical protein
MSQTRLAAILAADVAAYLRLMGRQRLASRAPTDTTPAV